jgi:hypothetical protein
MRMALVGMLLMGCGGSGGEGEPDVWTEMDVYTCANATVRGVAECAWGAESCEEIGSVCSALLNGDIEYPEYCPGQSRYLSDCERMAATYDAFATVRDECPFPDEMPLAGEWTMDLEAAEAQAAACQ